MSGGGEMMDSIRITNLDSQDINCMDIIQEIVEQIHQ